MRLPRSFSFVQRFDGRPIPFPLTTDADTERFRQGAARETVSWAFKADPNQVKAAMSANLLSAGWKRFELDEDSVDFYRGETRGSSYKGMPTEEIERVDDYATFISDRSVLNVGPEITCVAIVVRKSNLAELLLRLRR